MNVSLWDLPELAAASMANIATTVLPLPTSPCSSLHSVHASTGQGRSFSGGPQGPRDEGQ